MDVVWSCLSIIFLSTWSVLHLTLPPDITTRTTMQELRKQIYLLGRKMGWMGIMLVFPEYLVGTSATNLFSAWINTPHLKELADQDGAPWTLSHTILADLGGIAIRFSDASQQPSLVLQDNLSSSPKPGAGECDQGELDQIQPVRTTSIGLLSRRTDSATTMTRPARPGELSAEMKAAVHSPGLRSLSIGTGAGTQDDGTDLEDGETIPDFLRNFQKNQSSYLRNLGDIPWEPYKPHILLAANAPTKPDQSPRLVKNYLANHIAPLHGNIWILDSYQLILARRLGVVGKLPYIRAEEIADRSKTDGIVRLIAAIQVLWLAVQLVVRRVHDIPFTALEISTVAFSSCAFIIYLIEWHKPKDISLPIYLDTSVVVTPDVFSQIAEAAPVVFLQARHYYMPQSGFHLVHQGRYARKHLDQLMVVMTMVAIVLFAGIHLFVWDSHFPTPTERLLWRIAAITMAVAPISSAVLVSLESVLFQRTLYMSVGSVAVLTPIYLASRIFIMVESFRSLYFMPPGAFVATWTSNAPHFG